MAPRTPTKYEYKSIWTCWTQLCTLFGVKTRFWTSKSTSEAGGRISWNFPSTNFSSQRLPRSKLAFLDKKIPNPHAMGHTHTKFEHHPIKTEGALALKWDFFASNKVSRLWKRENRQTSKITGPASSLNADSSREFRAFRSCACAAHRGNKYHNDGNWCARKGRSGSSGAACFLSEIRTPGSVIQLPNCHPESN